SWPWARREDTLAASSINIRRSLAAKKAIRTRDRKPARDIFFIGFFGKSWVARYKTHQLSKCFHKDNLFVERIEKRANRGETKINLIMLDTAMDREPSPARSGPER